MSCSTSSAASIPEIKVLVGISNELRFIMCVQGRQMDGYLKWLTLSWAGKDGCYGQDMLVMWVLCAVP